MSAGELFTKADPSTTSRQLAEMRAEQSATAAAGFRDVFFGYDSWTVSEEGQQVLKRNAQWLRAHGMTQLKVEGHCDEREPPPTTSYSERSGLNPCAII